MRKPNKLRKSRRRSKSGKKRKRPENRQNRKKPKRAKERRERRKTKKTQSSLQNILLSSTAKNSQSRSKRPSRLMTKRTFSSLPRCLMLTTSLISETSLDVYFQPMYMPDTKDSTDRTCCIFAGLTSMARPLRSKPCKKAKHPKRFVTTISKFIVRFTSGLILTLTTSVGLVLLGIRQSPKRYSLKLKRTETFFKIS